MARYDGFVQVQDGKERFCVEAESLEEAIGHVQGLYRVGRSMVLNCVARRETVLYISKLERAAEILERASNEVRALLRKDA